MTTPAKSDFVAAEEIKGILHGRDRTEQERILRWVSESLSLGDPAAATSKPMGGGSANTTRATESGTAGHTRDIRTFVQQKQPKSDNQLATVIAFFYRFVAPEAERKEVLSTADLQTAARQARGYAFKTPSVTLNNAVQQGYLDRADRGAYKINAVGENLVAMTLPGAGGAASSTSNAARRAKKKAPKKKTSKNAK